MLASSSRGRRSACSSCGLLIEQPANATPSSSLLDRWSTAACRAVHALQSCARLARGHFQRTAACKGWKFNERGVNGSELVGSIFPWAAPRGQRELARSGCTGCAVFNYSTWASPH